MGEILDSKHEAAMSGTLKLLFSHKCLRGFLVVFLNFILILKPSMKSFFSVPSTVIDFKMSFTIQYFMIAKPIFHNRAASNDYFNN